MQMRVISLDCAEDRPIERGGSHSSRHCVIMGLLLFFSFDLVKGGMDKNIFVRVFLM